MQEAAAGYGAMKPARPQNSGSPMLTARGAILSIGVFTLGALVMLPLWNAVGILRDPIYVYFLGGGHAWAIITACIGVCASYILVVPGFVDSSSSNETALIMVANCFIVLLGTLFIVISCPMSTKANDASLGLFNNCEFGPANHQLFLHSQGLQVLRSRPDCDRMLTVESCVGFERSPSSEVLKQMENSLRCSGFCHPTISALLESNASLAAAPAPANAALIADAAALLVAAAPARTVAHGDGDAGAALLQAGVTFSGSNSQRQEPDLGTDLREPIEPYPPTLFSKADFKASCEGMTSRHLKYFAGDISSALFWEGILLIFIAVAVTVLRLFNMVGNKDGGSRLAEYESLVGSQGWQAQRGFM